MLSPPAADALAAATATRIARLRTRTSAIARHTYQHLGSWRSHDITRLETQLNELLRGVDLTVVGLTTASVAGLVDTPTVIGDITPPELDADWWATPFHATWSALATNPTDVTRAIGAGSNQLHRNIRNRIDDTHRHTVDTAARRARLTRYVRIPDSDPCGYCIAAAGRTYLLDREPQKLHDGCGCTARPLGHTETADQIVQPWVDAYNRLDLSDTSRSALAAQRLPPA